MSTKFHYVILRPDGTASNVWQYDHQPEAAPPNSVQLPLSDEQWNNWMQNTAGWRWDAGDHQLQEVPAVIPVPKTVTMVQACLAMRRTASPTHPNKSLYDDVRDFIAGVTDDELKIAWERATSLDRTGNFVNGVAQHLSLSNDQLDHLFTFAAAITV